MNRVSHRTIYETLVRSLKRDFMIQGKSEDKASRLANIHAVKETKIIFNLQGK